ncbi:hypothetical protein ABIC65_001095 [Sphingomonas trueperi]|uniref:GTA-gp10 family protein n=1 Tax=Sphingomonas trueperi TaxID=53317 RepID=UPI0033990EB4
MTVQTALELEFGDGSYLFDLKLPQLAELQRLREAGIFKIYGRVLRGRYFLGGEPVAVAEDGEAFAEDLYETIRLGLIGGGRGLVNGQEITVSALRAKQLVETYCHPAPLRECWTIAAAILGARVEGYESPKVGPAKGRATGKRSRKSTSPKSSRTAPSSDATGAN